MRLPAVVVAVALGLAACSAPPPAAQAPEPAALEHINVFDPWPYPFSSAVRAGGFIFVSGQVGSVFQDGKLVLVPGGIDAEARQTMDNVKQIVEHAGSSMERMVKCSVMLADMTEWPRFNEIYATYFPGAKPARAAWGANGLALGARVEVDCIALP